MDRTQSVNWITFGHKIERNILVEGVKAGERVRGSDLQRGEDVILVVELFGIDPGLRVIELEHIESSLDGVDAAL